MAINLAALVVIVASLVAAGALLPRHLPRPAGAGGVAAGVPAGIADAVACVRCGAPAASLPPDSFTCPGCGRDVRERGLAPPTAHLSLRPLWEAMLYTIAVLIAALLTTAVAMSAAPRTEYVTATTSLASPGSRAYAGVELTAVRSRRVGQQGAGRWELSADLLGLDGRMTSLEAGGPPERWKVTGPDGTPAAAGGRLDDEAVLKWMRMAGLDDDDPQIAAEAFEVTGEVEKALGTSHETRRRPPGGEYRIGFNSTSSGGGQGFNEARWVAPAMSAAWSVVWVAGLWAVLRVSARRLRKSADAAAVAAATAARSAGEAEWRCPA